MVDDSDVSVVHNELCPFCSEKKLTLSEVEQDIPFFGKTFIFGMRCSGCGYKKSDVECAEKRPSCKIIFDITSKEDMGVRVVKSSQGNVKFGSLGDIESGEGSDGYVTNIEGLLERFKKVVENLRDTEEDEDIKKKAKNAVKKLLNVMWGHDTLKLSIDDPSGNSAIISEKAIVKK